MVKLEAVTRCPPKSPFPIQGPQDVRGRAGLLLLGTGLRGLTVVPRVLGNSRCPCPHLEDSHRWHPERRSRSASLNPPWQQRGADWLSPHWGILPGCAALRLCPLPLPHSLPLLAKCHSCCPGPAHCFLLLMAWLIFPNDKGKHPPARSELCMAPPRHDGVCHPCSSSSCPGFLGGLGYSLADVTPQPGRAGWPSGSQGNHLLGDPS